MVENNVYKKVMYYYYYYYCVVVVIVVTESSFICLLYLECDNTCSVLGARCSVLGWMTAG